MIENTLEKLEISWRNCVGLPVDNISVNVGCRNSIKTHAGSKSCCLYYGVSLTVT